MPGVVPLWFGTLPASRHGAEQVVEVVVVRVGPRTAHAHPQVHVAHPVGWEEGGLGTGSQKKERVQWKGKDGDEW